MLKKAKAIFKEISEILYDMDNKHMDEFIYEMEEEIKKENSIRVIQESINEIEMYVSQVSDVDPEIMAHLDELYAELLEL